MLGLFEKGLTLDFAGPSVSADTETIFTDEASILATIEEDLRVEPLVAEGASVAQGAPILALRRQPSICLTAPMAGRIGHLDLGAGHRLRKVTLFHEPAAGRYQHAETTDLAALLQASGLWTMIRSRPFGRWPKPTERPRAIVVMALDTRPGAPDPVMALRGVEAAFARGLAALTRLVDGGRVLLCQAKHTPPFADIPAQVEVIRSATRHPWGLAGFQVHHHCPARPDAPVWDIAAEDVAAIGTLLETGTLPETRLVSIAGGGLRDARTVRCQPWADLRGLAQGHLRPGPNVILSGSLLDGVEARWLRPRDRQVTVRTPEQERRAGHWFLKALTHASRPLPLIPSAAVDHALGGALPAMPFLRALASGDEETAARLGLWSFLPEDLSLVDYVTAAEPKLSAVLAVLLARIEAETMA